MYIVTKFDSLVKYKGYDLSEFLYSDFDFRLENGRIFIRPKNYKEYKNIDFEENPITYSKECTEHEIISDFMKSNFKKYAKRFDYQIYSVEQCN